MIRDKNIFLVACQRALITVVICLTALYCAKSIAAEKAQLASSLQQGSASTTDAGISLPWALEQALLNNIALKSFPYSLRASEALTLQAGITPNPELSVSVENILGTGDMQGVDNAEIKLLLSIFSPE